MTTTINNEHKKLNVPNLRFPEFQGEWEEYTLQDVVTFSNGKAHENCVNDDGDYILVNSKFVSTNGQVQKRVTSQLSPLHKSQFVMVMSDLPNGKALAKCFYVEEDNKYTLNQRVCSFTSNDGNVSRFLMYQINRNKYYLRFDDGINQTNLKKSEVLSCPVFIPIVREQEKIATLLCKIDERIATQNKIIEKLQSLIKGLVDELMTVLLKGKLYPFSSFYIKAGEGGTPTTSVVEYYTEGTIPFIKIEDLSCKYLTNNKDFITELGMQKSSAWLIPSKSVIYSNGATIGAISINEYPVCTKQGILGIVPNTNINVEYLYLLMSSSYFSKEISRIITEGTMKTAYLKDINHIKCPLPSMAQQKNITNLTSSIEEKLSIEQELLRFLNLQKQYLLHMIFI